MKTPVCPIKVLHKIINTNSTLPVCLKLKALYDFNVQGFYCETLHKLCYGKFSDLHGSYCHLLALVCYYKIQLGCST